MMIADHRPRVHDGRGATGQANICEAVDIGDPEKRWSHAASRRVLCRGVDDHRHMRLSPSAYPGGFLLGVLIRGVSR